MANRARYSSWVSADEVKQAYRRMQKQVLEGRNSLPDAKTFEVARFVWEQERQHQSTGRRGPYCVSGGTKSIREINLRTTVTSARISSALRRQ